MRVQCRVIILFIAMGTILFTKPTKLFNLREMLKRKSQSVVLWK